MWSRWKRAPPDEIDGVGRHHDLPDACAPMGRRAMWFNQWVEPPSWIVGDAVIAAGAKGILFPSRLAKGGINLVLYTQVLASSDMLKVFDPEKALPLTQASWR